ncbi:sulfur oxidation c-type cytochrome SoxX [Stappia stellulata]|uniref:sulfur oxidation c-type cytochrome SoxX n=1 Tax=Stappia stellulata TaxID=71235 RepID=UPI00041C008A|nr:sulfur oxidation c-type cytochrome SoxX [Stappia stellulata]
MSVIRQGTIAACVLLLGVATASASDIASFEVVDGTIPQPLTDVAGDPVAGKQAVVDRKLGNCLACHTAADLANEPFHGEVGPPLDGVADRWDEATLRMIVVNPKMVYDGTIMPAFHRVEGLNLVMDKFAGKPILTAQQVEDVVAYLKTLSE